jgi:hypothetical protein
MPRMLFPKPFAPKPEPAPKFTRSKAESSTVLPRHTKLALWRREEQAEMRKEAAHIPGEWISTVSGVALFVPEQMFERARRAVGVEVGALKRAA